MTSLSIGSWQVFSLKSQVLYATLGFAIFGVGIEMIGITANKVVVKWFRGKALALALGLNVAAGRIGTAIAMFGSLPFARAMGSPSAPLLVCLIMFCIGLLSFLVFCVMDRRYDRETETERPFDNEKTDEEEFRFSDIFRIARIKAFWYITILCVLFYSAVFPFLKYATELMIQKFHVSPEFAGSIPAATEVVDLREPGLALKIDGLNLKVLGVTNEEFRTNPYNNSSTIIRAWDRDKSVVFLGDAGVECGDKVLAGPYRDDLNCDYLQMAHHGQQGCSEEFYKSIRFRACLWPTPTWVWNNDNGTGINTHNLKTFDTRRWMDEIGITEHHISWQGLTRIG